MDGLTDFTLLAASTWIPILNPFGILPQFVAFTQDLSPRQTHAVARRAATIALVVLAVCVLVGSLLFKAFGITVPAFRLAGGVILFLIALDMLRANPLRFKTSKEEQTESIEREDVAIFPVAIPLIAGPGSITTALVLGEQAKGTMQYVVLLGVLAVAMLFMYLALRYADRLLDRLGHIGRNVLTRVMGIVLAAVAAQFILDVLVAIK